MIVKGAASKPTQLSLRRRHYLNYPDQETNLFSAPEAVLSQDTSDYKLVQDMQKCHGELSCNKTKPKNVSTLIAK